MNWHQRIDAARKRGSFTQEDKILSGDWPDCACGEQDPRIKRGLNGRPLDSRLFGYGVQFDIFVNEHKFDMAEIMLLHIEKRAGEILVSLEAA
jgi:hypothetical protein